MEARARRAVHGDRAGAGRDGRQTDPRPAILSGVGPKECVADVMWPILTSAKSFDDRWIGHPTWNERGLHVRRMQVARWCTGVRRRQCRLATDAAARALAENGYVVVPDFLPGPAFDALRTELHAAAAAAERHTPIRPNDLPGFGPKRPAPWGFDRFDGGTLNRFLRIDRDSLPRTTAFCGNARLAGLSRTAVGMAVPRRKFWIYQTVNGDQARNPDDQKVLHRDTFFSNIKLWYFVDPVTDEDGPFVYVPKSHILTDARLAWEHEQARLACQARRDGTPGTGGAFRFLDGDLATLGLGPARPLPVAANSLIVADTLGFHRRGDARAGARRLAIFGSIRPWAFDPLGR